MKSSLSLISVFCLSGHLATAAPASQVQGKDLIPPKYGSVSNEIVDGTPCKPITIIYARGTGQDGNLGSPSDVGPKFINDFAGTVGIDKVAVQGVDYSAKVHGFFGGGDDKGSDLMANLIGLTSDKCPQTKLVVSGFSQGGQLIRNAADLLPPGPPPIGIADFVAAVLIFGNPGGHETFFPIQDNRVRIYCHGGDTICSGTAFISPSHFDYAKDAPGAAKWLAGFLGFGPVV